MWKNPRRQKRFRNPMRDERVTIRQLAHLSGVSIGTVSRALNGYADVNPETRERIVRLARELDYTPAAAARSLVTQRSHVVGVFLETGEGHPDLQHPFFHEVLVGLKHEIGAGGYDLLLFASEQPGNGYGDALLPQARPPPQRRGRRAHGRRRRGPRGPPAHAQRPAVRRRRRRAERAGDRVRHVRQRRRRRRCRRASARARPPPDRDDHGPRRDAPGRRPPPRLPRRAARPRPRLPRRVRRLRRLLRRVAAARRWPACSTSTSRRPPSSAPRT